MPIYRPLTTLVARDARTPQSPSKDYARRMTAQWERRHKHHQRRHYPSRRRAPSALVAPSFQVHASADRARRGAVLMNKFSSPRGRSWWPREPRARPEQVPWAHVRWIYERAGAMGACALDLQRAGAMGACALDLKRAGAMGACALDLQSPARRAWRLKLPASGACLRVKKNSATRTREHPGSSRAWPSEGSRKWHAHPEVARFINRDVDEILHEPTSLSLLPQLPTGTPSRFSSSLAHALGAVGHGRDLTRRTRRLPVVFILLSLVRPAISIVATTRHVRCLSRV